MEAVMAISVREEAVILISENLGEITAKSYEKFYRDKSDEVIKASVFELLTEVLGEKKAQEKIGELKW